MRVLEVNNETWCDTLLMFVGPLELNHMHICVAFAFLKSFSWPKYVQLMPTSHIGVPLDLSMAHALS